MPERRRRLPGCESVLAVLVIVAAAVVMAVHAAMAWLSAHWWVPLAGLGVWGAGLGVAAGLTIRQHRNR